MKRETTQMIIPSTGVLLLAAAILLVLMTFQWFIGGMSLSGHRAQTPETGPAKAAAEFNQAA
jgi:hypothetical protein